MWLEETSKINRQAAAKRQGGWSHQAHELGGRIIFLRCDCIYTVALPSSIFRNETPSECWTPL